MKTDLLDLLANLDPTPTPFFPGLKHNHCKSEFEVLDLVNIEPGTYMYKDGELVEYDGSDVSSVVVIEEISLKEYKKRK